MSHQPLCGCARCDRERDHEDVAAAVAERAVFRMRETGATFATLRAIADVAKACAAANLRAAQVLREVAAEAFTAAKSAKGTGAYADDVLDDFAWTLLDKADALDGGEAPNE